MSQPEKIDRALCELNQEILDLRHSPEYQFGVKVSKLIYAIKHLQFRTLLISFEHKKVIRKLSKGHKANIEFLTFDGSIETNTRIAVYTCITGYYDKLLEPVYVPENVDFYIITDMAINLSSAWKKIDINTVEEVHGFDNTRKARYMKTHPHVFFKDYEYSIWVDSNIRVVGDLSKFIKCVGKTVPFASNWHPDRNSIYAEVEACISRKKDDPDLLRKHIDNYKKVGMPEDFGLIETNMIVRKHMEKCCIELMELWWGELMQWSKRDQLSLPYVIWKSGYTMRDFGFIGNEIRHNPSVQVVLHESKYRAPTR